jgi:hypothetical protein
MIQALPPLAASQSLTIVGGQNCNQQRSFGAEPKVGCAAKPTSAFITQLLASKHSAAAFRQKRRCSPTEAKNAYSATQALVSITGSMIIHEKINFAA